MTKHILNKLKERRTSENLRKLSLNNELIDFASNDYLGLARSEGLYEKISSYDYSDIVNKNGSTGSRLLAGNSKEYTNLEDKLAGIFNSEAALLFNSGYCANLSIVSSIPQKGDTILYDSLSHICLKEGAWLSKAESLSFQHNNLEDLQLKLQRAKGEVFVIIESIYSMDGDKSPLLEIIELTKKYGAQLIIDEAHSTGIMGTGGAGMVCEMNIEREFLARTYTFGKGMGVHGACICGSKELVEYLINFGRPFIYTTALPIHSIFSIDAAFNYLTENIELQVQLQNNIDYFNETYNDQLKGKTEMYKPYSDTAIQPIVIPGNKKIKQIAERIQESGLDVRPILSPTVKAGTERLRVSIHAHNTKAEIDKLINELGK